MRPVPIQPSLLSDLKPVLFERANVCSPHSLLADPARRAVLSCIRPGHCRATNDELRRVDHPARSEVPALDLLEQQPSRGAAELMNGNVNRGQAGDESAGQGNVVIADDCRILWDSQAAAPHDTVGADRGYIG